MNNSILPIEYNRKISWGMLFIIINSFLVQYYVDIVHSYVFFIAALFLGCLVLLLSKKNFFVVSKDPVLLWYLAIVVILFSLAKNRFDINTFSDLVAIITGVVMCTFSGDSENNFQISCKVIILFAVYYAVTVWIQFIFPGLYGNFLRLMPEQIQYQIMTQQGSFAFTGFSSNLGFTAGHITAGIMLLLTVGKKKNVFFFFMAIFLFISLLLTGKRSTFAFFILSFIIVFLLSGRGKKKVNRVLSIIVIVSFLIFLLFMLRDQFEGIPVFRRIFETFDGLKTGQDVTSNRSIIYSYAITLFREHPIWGIGWGHFRSMSLGNITQFNTIEVHNIYLQLLCETGIIGFIVVVVPLLAQFINTYKNFKTVLTVSDEKWLSLMTFSIAYQIFFLLYGFVENALYDPNFVLMYFFACAINVAYYRRIRKKPNQYIQKDNILRENGGNIA